MILFNSCLEPWQRHFRPTTPWGHSWGHSPSAPPSLHREHWSWFGHSRWISESPRSSTRPVCRWTVWSLKSSCAAPNSMASIHMKQNWLLGLQVVSGENWALHMHPIKPKGLGFQFFKVWGFWFGFGYFENLLQISN